MFKNLRTEGLNQIQYLTKQLVKKKWFIFYRTKQQT